MNTLSYVDSPGIPVNVANAGTPSPIREDLETVTTLDHSLGSKTYAGPLCANAEKFTIRS